MSAPATTTVVGLCGRKQAGKDSVADVLVREFGFVRVAVADPLKDAVRAVFGFTGEQVSDGTLKEKPDPFWGVTPRLVLQVVGTELFRQALPRAIPSMEHIWPRALVRRIQDLPRRRVVVTDVRYQDECDAIRGAFHTHIWQVVRPGAQATDAHLSEAWTCPDPDAVIDNAGTMSQLWARVVVEADRIHMAS